MGKKTLFLLAMAMLLLLPSQARAQDSPQQPVDLTTRMANTTHDGLRKIKNQPSKKIDFAAAKTDAATVQKMAADKKRDAALVRRQATSLEGLNGIYLIGNKKVFVK